MSCKNKLQHNIMEYKKGDRVRHPSKEEWGVGEVLTDSNGQTVIIFFVGGGERTLSLEYVQPIPFDGEDEKREVKKPKDNKQEYVNSVIDADIKSGTDRSLYDLCELGKLASEQFDDDTSNVKSEVIPCQII